MKHYGKEIILYIISLLKVIIIVTIALFLPQMFIWHSHYQQKINNSSTGFRLGIENMSKAFIHSLSRNGTPYSIGLITNQTGTDQAGNRTIDILIQNGCLIRKVFVPTTCPISATNTQTITSEIINEIMKIPVVMIPTTAQHSQFTQAMLADVDILMFDMQDAGMKQYGYVSLLLNAIQAAVSYDKKIIIFDRPNLLGACMEGICTTPSITQEAIPMRYGMTVGEMAVYFNKNVLKNSAQLNVVQMANYNRYHEVRKPLLSNLSPNITSIDSCYGYSFLGLLGEVTPFEIGIGSDKAFQCLLLPDSIQFSKKKWHDLRLLLQEYGIESKVYRAFSQRKNCQCTGLRLYVNDINQFSSFGTLITVLKFFNDSGVTLSFSKTFDTIVGTHNMLSLLNGSISHEQLAHQINDELATFFKKASTCFLYKPFPAIRQV